MCKWIVDADQIQIKDFDNRILYRNPLVDSFVYDDRKLGIEAPKGLGKTFLMKSKRMESQRFGIRCLPRDSMLDVMEKATFSESMNKYLDNYSNWIDMWKIAIVLSIIKACDGDVIAPEEVRVLVDEKVDFLFCKIYGSPVLITACQVMNALINSERSSVRITQINIPLYIAAIKKIRQPIHLFIDKTDQALRDNIHYIQGSSKMSRGPSNNSYWAYGQLSLAEASYQLFVQNPHIKVYYGIRSEALVGAEMYTDIFMQLRSYMVKLEYSYFELRRIFEHYISIEDDKWLINPAERGCNAEKAFVGVDSIEHGYVKGDNGSIIYEEFFRYMYRHTLKRPRDIMHICYRLCYSNIRYMKDYADKCKEIRHVVNKESRLLLQSYLREIGPFIFDNHKEGWHIFWSNVETNVFTIDYAKSLCRIINIAVASGNSCVNNCSICNCFKPFSSLYNAGLLGVLSFNNVQNGGRYIKFQGTGETIICTEEELLPKSQLYFLHPMVTNKIEATRRDKNLSFEMCTSLIVGDDYKVGDKIINKVQHKEDDRTSQKRLNSIFLSSTCFDLSDHRSMLYRELARCGYYVVMSEKNDFRMPEDDVASHDYCLDKVLECSNMIYLIGPRYGGVYRGEKYRLVAEKIKRLNSDIEEPSISLMEFFVAKENGITPYVFTQKNIYNERNTYIKNKHNGSFIPAFAYDNRVFEIISLITKLQTGNWFKCFDDLDDLIEIIRIQFESLYSRAGR